jgi:serine/threonine protein phosphatase 1
MADRDRSKQERFAVLRRARRVWAVAAIHGEAGRLASLHRVLADAFEPGDRLVYLGNYLGGSEVIATIDELLAFRRSLIARPLLFASDLAYLRGSLEEMWQKLLQLQFAPNPREVFTWMMEHGTGAALRAYGGDEKAGATAAREGAVGITRWTQSLRAAMQARPGHYTLMSALRRAALTDDGGLLFVHAGIDPSRPLSAQSDSFWWNLGGFSRLAQPYAGFRRVIRGYDRRHSGLVESPYTTSIDAGSGFGGPLLAACFDPDGTLLATIEA